MEQAAYVGDVLSFYLDNQFQENFLQYARQSNNIYELAYMFGYKPKVTSTSNTTLDVFQEVPSKIVGSEYVPDLPIIIRLFTFGTLKVLDPLPDPYVVETSANKAL